MTDELTAQPVSIATVSTVQAAANALRELILDGKLEPGARLRENDFAERLGIARHSFRAATQILIGEGLLRREPHRGVQVPVLEEEDIRDIFRLREALEIDAVRLVIQAGVVPVAAQKAVLDMEVLPDDAPWREVVEPDMRYHRALIDATGSERMARAYSGLQSEITLCMIQLRPHYERAAEVTAEHEGMLAPIVDGDGDQAEELLRVHLKEAEENQINALRESRAAGAEEVSA
jgi:DNA-binding GntR family transcriptional regulator